jgi:hypothetical protein
LWVALMYVLRDLDTPGPDPRSASISHRHELTNIVPACSATIFDAATLYSQVKPRPSAVDSRPLHRCRRSVLFG